jgi:hypothetical protein
LNEPNNVNILTFDEADQVEQQQNSPTPSLPATWRPGLFYLVNLRVTNWLF